MFILVALIFALIAMLIVVLTPKDEQTLAQPTPWYLAYGKVIANTYTWKIGPIGFFNYATLVAIQTLWAGPWLTNVVGYSAEEAATGLFWINLIMLFVFLLMGVITPLIIKTKAGAEGGLKITIPLSLAALFMIGFMGHEATWEYFSIYCIASCFLALTHPAVGQHFEANQAGRAIAFFNLLLFLGVFCAQWGVGLIIEKSSSVLATGYQNAFVILFGLSTLSYIWFLCFDKVIYQEGIPK
jgi:hypothetical protein